MHYMVTEGFLFAVDLRGLIGDPEETLLIYFNYLLDMRTDFFCPSHESLPDFLLLELPVILRLNCR